MVGAWRLFEGEVVYGEVADELPCLSADSGQEIDGGDVSVMGDCWIGRGGRARIRARVVEKNF